MTYNWKMWYLRNVCHLITWQTLGNDDRTTAHWACLLAWAITGGTQVPREMQLRATLTTYNGYDSLLCAGTGSGKTLLIVLNLLLNNPAENAISLTISPLKWLQVTQAWTITWFGCIHAIYLQENDFNTKYGIPTVAINDDTPCKDSYWKVSISCCSSYCFPIGLRNTSMISRPKVLDVLTTLSPPSNNYLRLMKVTGPILQFLYETDTFKNSSSVLMLRRHTWFILLGSHETEFQLFDLLGENSMNWKHFFHTQYHGKLCLQHFHHTFSRLLWWKSFTLITSQYTFHLISQIQFMQCILLWQA